MPTTPVRSLQSLEQLLLLLGERWLIRKNAAALIRTCPAPVPQPGQIKGFGFQEQPDGCIVASKTPALHPLYLSLDDGPLSPDEINGKLVVCCHKPFFNHVLVFDATERGPTKLGTLAAWDIKNEFPRGSIFAQVTVHSLFSTEQ